MELKTNYEIGDSELVYLVSENSDEAKDFLYEKYSPMIHKEINRVKKLAYTLGIDMADLTQEAMLAFSTAINNYNDEEETKFLTFATLCVRRKLQNYLDKYSTNKVKTYNSSVALDVEIGDKGEHLVDYLKDAEGRAPLNKLINEESLVKINKSIKEKLSENERLALGYALIGMEVPDIAEKMGKTQKGVYNLIYRARQKLKEDE